MKSSLHYRLYITSAFGFFEGQCRKSDEKKTQKKLTWRNKDLRDTINQGLDGDKR